MEIYVKNTLSLPVTNENGSYEIRLESIGGLGANLCGKMLGELGALSLSLNSLSFSSYGSEKRGSPVKAYVRWCADDRPLRVNSPVTRPHLLGIFHRGLIGTYPVLEGVTVDTKIVLSGCARTCDGKSFPHQHGHARCSGARQRIYPAGSCRNALPRYDREKISRTHRSQSRGSAPGI